MFSTYKNISLFIAFSFIVNCFAVLSQNNVNSINRELSHNLTDTLRIKNYFQLGEKYKIDKPDSAILFYKKGIEVFNKLSDNEQNKNIFIKCDLIRNIGLCYKNLTEPDKALEFYNTSLQLSLESNYKLGSFKCFNNIGNVYMGISNYASALSNFFDAQQIAETLEDKSMLATCNLNIGIIYFYQNNYDKALAYYNKSLVISNLLKKEQDIADCYTNIGVVLMAKNKNNEAINYFKRANIIFQKNDDKVGILNCYTNLGDIYSDINQTDKALEYYTKSIKLSEIIGDKTSIAYLYNSLAKLYLEKASSNNKTTAQLAIRYAKMSLQLSHSIKAILYERNAADILLKAYKIVENNYLALVYADLYIKLNDSIFSKDKTTALAETELKFKTERKQLEIDKLNQEKKLQQSENLRQKILIFCSLGGFMLLVIFTVFIVNRLKITRLQKQTIEVQKYKIETILHDVNQSIDYATLIQNSVLPEINSLDQYVASHFVLYLPKDRVSGDFYWWTKIYDSLIITVSDCTGHGVPGAMMSMLGSSLLREIVLKEEVTNPDAILSKLRAEIIKALKQTHSPKARKDGMDMSLITINLKTNVLHFAGANNPIYIIRKNETETILEEYKADRMPIAIYDRMDDFTCQEIKYKKGDKIYLFTDGYNDQFGGPKSKKFMSRNFKNLLLEISSKPMDEQLDILNNKLEEWKSGYTIKNKQIDDITVLGIEL